MVRGAETFFLFRRKPHYFRLAERAVLCVLKVLATLFCVSTTRTRPVRVLQTMLTSKPRRRAFSRETPESFPFLPDHERHPEPHGREQRGVCHFCAGVKTQVRPPFAHSSPLAAACRWWLIYRTAEPGSLNHLLDESHPTTRTPILGCNERETNCHCAKAVELLSVYLLAQGRLSTSHA